MSRDDGFSIADTDTGMLADPKVLALARRLRDSIRTGAALALYDAVRLASWKAGQRLTLDETVPGWWLDPFDDLALALVAVGLLDDQRRIPGHAWEGWFGPALARRLDTRRKSIYGGLVSHGMSPDHANREADARIEAERSRLLNLKAEAIGPSYKPELKPELSPSLTTRPPSVPSEQDSAVPRARERVTGTVSAPSKGWDGGTWGPEWEPLRIAFDARGFRKPPTPRQREMLWPIVDARPDDAGRWATEAPVELRKGKPGAASELIGCVLREWDAFRATTKDAPQAEPPRPPTVEPPLPELTPAEAAAAWGKVKTQLAGIVRSKSLDALPSDHSAEIKARQTAERRATYAARVADPKPSAYIEPSSLASQAKAGQIAAVVLA